MADSRVVGPRIAEDRKKAEVTVIDFAAAIGATPEQVETIESGAVETPYIILLRASVVLSVSPSKWLRGVTAHGDEFAQSLLDNADNHYRLLQALREGQAAARKSV